MSTQRARFQDATWFNSVRDFHVIVGGAGGIGSWVTFFLIRAGFHVTVIDYDLVEEHNIGGQLFSPFDIGESKIEALSNTINNFNFKQGQYTGIEGKVPNDVPVVYSKVIYVSAFDNMLARKEFFNSFIQQIRESGKMNNLYIDGRLLMEQMTVFCLDSTADMAEYKNHLFDDSEVEDLPCSMKQTTHSAAMIASHMVGFITNHVANYAIESKQFAVPFQWNYLIPLNHTY